MPALQEHVRDIDAVKTRLPRIEHDLAFARVARTAVYFANGGIMELNKSEFYPQPERHDGVLSAVIAGFVAGVTATITMLKLVR